MRRRGWTTAQLQRVALIFTAIIVVIAVAGSLWVMYNMNVNMMPHMASDAM